MAFDSLSADVQSRIIQVGKAGLNAIFPKEFNYFAISLELVDSRGRTVDYFLFPVNPSEIRETVREITNIRKTISGVSVLKNPTFIPSDIVISGDFGRNFKAIVNGQPFQFAGIQLSLNQGLFGSIKSDITRKYSQFSSIAKTGYGCVKVIEGIKDKSKGLDLDGKPYSLYLYNPILGNNYQVEFVSFDHFQNDKNSNMIAKYSIRLQSVAPLDSLFSKLKNIKSTVKNLAFSALQKKANNIAKDLRGLLGK